MDISLTVFNSIFDNKTDKGLNLDNFDAFEKFLYKLSKIEKKSKKDAVLISPATYQPDTTRANANVIEWAGWCCVDVDEYKPTGDLQDDLRNRFSSYRFVCYSTASSSLDSPKFRMVFPLRKRIGSDEIRHFWHALNTELGELGDAQTKDLSRMYYIPAKYSGAFNFIFSHDGDALDPTALMRKHPYAEKANLNNFFDRLPDELQKQIIEHRKGKMDNTNVSWSTYRDCPFFPRKLEAEYRLINNTGWYHKMYQIMVAVAGNAVKQQYPITSNEIAKMCQQLDMETGNWYKNRPLDKEADRALEYVYKNM
tara:strand:+ start:163 stop:1092 length:930 start_codon:yes stop_codon:yes gene_type:complete